MDSYSVCRATRMTNQFNEPSRHTVQSKKFAGAPVR